MYRLKYSQILPLTVEACWDFFSSPKNLKILTPKHLGFEMILGDEGEKMYAGQIIGYKIFPLWKLPITWITEITHVEKPLYFIDEQRFGPYKFWHHEHRFIPHKDGVEIIDIVHYKMPFGFLGHLFHRLKVRKDLEAIFAYRKNFLEKRFGSSNPTQLVEEKKF